MNFKDLTAAISEQEQIPAGKVRKVAKALLHSISAAIDSGEQLYLPGLTFRNRTQPAREAEFDRPARPERKIVILGVNAKKQAELDSVAS